MNQGPLLFLGILATLAASFWGLILAPEMRIGQQQQITNSMTGALYPAPRSGAAQRGAEVYRSLGCAECHSQQVRGVGADLARGWGARMTVAQDYLGDYPVMLGDQRMGPDLANIGTRQTHPPDLLRHLYNPQAVTPGSIMPSYRFLFEKRKLFPGQKPDSFALEVTQNFQIVPGPQAEALVAYLLSLRTDSPLFEAPLAKSQGGGAATNAPTAGGTPSSAANPSTNTGPALAPPPVPSNAPPGATP